MQTVTEEDDVRFSALLSARPKPEVKWFKDKFEMKEKGTVEADGEVGTVILTGIITL